MILRQAVDGIIRCGNTVRFGKPPATLSGPAVNRCNPRGSRQLHGRHNLFVHMRSGADNTPTDGQPITSFDMRSEYLPNF